MRTGCVAVLESLGSGVRGGLGFGRAEGQRVSREATPQLRIRQGGRWDMMQESGAARWLGPRRGRGAQEAQPGSTPCPQGLTYRGRARLACHPAS